MDSYTVSMMENQSASIKGIRDGLMQPVLRQLADVTDFRMDAGYTVGNVTDALTHENL